jgi:hypothetical protein
MRNIGHLCVMSSDSKFFEHEPGNVYSRDLSLVANRLFHDRIPPEMLSVLATDQHSPTGF